VFEFGVSLGRLRARAVGDLYVVVKWCDAWGRASLEGAFASPCCCDAVKPGVRGVDKRGEIAAEGFSFFSVSIRRVACMGL